MTICRDCERPRPHRGRGLCRTCYQRNERRGTIDRFPRKPKPGRRPDPREHGTVKGWYQHYRRGEDPCDGCAEALRADAAERRKTDEYRAYHRDYQPKWKRRRAEGRITAPSVIFDVLETTGTSMGARSLITWVLELHPEWAEETVKRTLHRLVSEGRVLRVEFGDEIRYRI